MPPGEQRDIRRLTPAALVRLVNSTPLGAVLTAAALRAHRDAAGLRIGDGRCVDFVRYVAWLAGRLQERTTAAEAAGASAADRYIQAKRAQAQRNRAATKAAQDIAPIPDVADWKRREAAVASLRAFCESYAAKAFCWPWSADHLRAIAIIEEIGAQGGMFALAMFRGAGKTTLARWAALWMLLSNRVGYVCPIGGTQSRAARQLLAPVKLAMLQNALLLADFPDAVYPLRCLENSSKRQLQQHCGGQLTHVRWEPDRIVFPWLDAGALPASFARRGAQPAAQGAVYAVDSLDGEIRGQQHERPDGTVVRPGLVLLDDPQTRSSARSALQTENRLDLIHGDVRYLAGPDQSVAAVALCTRIYAGDLTDRLLSREHSPDWQSQCTRFLIAFPENLRLWDEYWDLRRGRGATGVKESNRFYRARRADMDAASQVAWEHAYDRRSELSAVQHAMNLYLAKPAMFMAEYQNDPQTEQAREDRVQPGQVAARTNGRPRGQAPRAAVHLTAFVDLHDALLYWCVCAWEADLTGYVIDYGTLPEQPRQYFTMRQASETLGRRYRGRSVDAAMRCGLEELAKDLLGRDWPNAGGGVGRIGRMLVDMGYKPEIAGAVKHVLGGDTLWLSKGVGIRAANRPMSEYRRQPGEVHGCHWYLPNVRGTREFRHVATDVNWWKSAVHAALACPIEERASISLFGRQPAQHELFADHVAGSETWVATSGRGRTVHEWRIKPGDPDNHWLDCLVGCAVAASTLGAIAPGQEGGRPIRRKRYTQENLRRR